MGKVYKRLNMVNTRGRTPLMYAAENGQLHHLNSLIFKDHEGKYRLDVIDYTDVSNKSQTTDSNHVNWGFTALMYAAKGGRVDCVKSLLK